MKLVGPRKAKQLEPGNNLAGVGLDLGYTNPGEVEEKLKNNLAHVELDPLRRSHVVSVGTALTVTE